MSSMLKIVCEKCGSYRVKPRRQSDQVFDCACCGAEFNVENAKDYSKRNPPDVRRCQECNALSVIRIEMNHRRDDQPEDEIADLYRCEQCGHKVLLITQGSEFVLYD
jgi:DNA-directed RNA polymerase subunit M/transcription elongation factor TFIIS